MVHLIETKILITSHQCLFSRPFSEYCVLILALLYLSHHHLAQLDELSAGHLPAAALRREQLVGRHDVLPALPGLLYQHTNLDKQINTISSGKKYIFVTWYSNKLIQTWPHTWPQKTVEIIKWTIPWRSSTDRLIDTPKFWISKVFIVNL